MGSRSGDICGAPAATCRPWSATSCTLALVVTWSTSQCKRTRSRDPRPTSSRFGSGGHRQAHPECRSAPERTPDADAARVGFHQLSRDRQAQAGAAHRQGRAMPAAIELFEDAFAVFGGDAGALIDHLDLDALVDNGGADANLGAPRRVASR